VPANTQALMGNIQTLPPDRLVEREDVVGFLRPRDTGRALIRAASAPARLALRNNLADAAYEARP
jgi:hypothetical protein